MGGVDQIAPRSDSFPLHTRLPRPPTTSDDSDASADCAVHEEHRAEVPRHRGAVRGRRGHPVQQLEPGDLLVLLGWVGWGRWRWVGLGGWAGGLGWVELGKQKVIVFDD